MLLAVSAQAVGSLLGLAPLLILYELARELLPSLQGKAIEADRVWALAWGLIAVLATMLAALSVAAIASHLADNRLGHHLRRALIDHLGTIPLGWFDANSSGRVKKAIQDDVAVLHHLVSHGSLDLTTALITPAAILITLCVIDPGLTLVALLPIGLGMLAYAAAQRGATASYAAYDRDLGTLNGALVEFITGITVIKAFGETGRAHLRFAQAASRFCNFFHQWVARTTLAAACFELAISPPAILACVVVGGGLFAARGWIAPIDVLPFVLLGLGLTASVIRLMYGAEQMRQALGAAGRIAALLAVPRLPEPAPAPAPRPAHWTGKVEFDDVSFSYDGVTAVVRDVTLTLAPGTLTALVGPSGAGKSTLARLLPRFSDVDRGQIRLDGIDLRLIPARRLYQLIGFVFQDVALLRLSLRDNIRLGRPDAPDTAIETAARAARIHERILALPKGYDSVVGDDVTLSGGEAQRVSIARALLADPPVLVLDEATAFADPDSEAAIQEALSRLIQGRTLLVIAHRLQTIVQADQIVVLRDGRIIEQGRHDALLRQNGLYQRMWATAEGLSAPLPSGVAP
jgi:ATP-binding cassette subfamily B protein